MHRKKQQPFRDTLTLKNRQGTIAWQNLSTGLDRVALHVTSVFLVYVLTDNKQEPISAREISQLL